MKFKRPNLRQIGMMLLGLFLTALFAWHVAQGPGRGLTILDALERQAYDLRIGLSVENETDPRIIIIDIDEESLNKVGQWPWPRAILAQLVEILFSHYNIDTLGFDVVFAEAETTFTPQALAQAQAELRQASSSKTLEDVLKGYQGDAQMATAMRDRNIVLGYVFDGADDVESVGVLPAPLFSDEAIVSETQAPKRGRYSANLDRLQASAQYAGFFSLGGVTDSDGIIRRVPLLNNYQGALYDALPLAMVQRFLGASAEPVFAPVSQDAAYLSLEALDLGLTKVPLDSQASVFVPYRATRGAYQYVSAWEVLEGVVDDGDALSGTLALVGTSASGLVDLRNTPLENAFPGVEIHANLLSGLLDGQFRVQPSWTSGVDFTLVIAIGGLLALLLPIVSILVSTLLVALVFAALVGANLTFWFSLNWVVPIASISVLVWLLYSFNTLIGFFAESRSRAIMRSMFGLYIPPEIVDEMSETPDVYSLKSEKRQMSVLFSDVRGFTTISESLTPEGLSTLLNTLLTPITEIIHRHNGAIDKYMGDAVMAFWGAPIPSHTHASQSISAALAMIDKLDKINEDFSERNWPQMRMGIGISTGPMSVGNMGSEFRMAYTVLGDSVNLGSRLEGLTKMYGVDLIVSENTMLSAPDYVYQELDLVRVKGKTKPEKIFAPLGLKAGNELVANLKVYHKALKHYRAQEWQAASALFEQLQSDDEQRLHALYLDRIRELSTQGKLENWDGVTTLEHK